MRIDLAAQVIAAREPRELFGKLAKLSEQHGLALVCLVREFERRGGPVMCGMIEAHKEKVDLNSMSMAQLLHSLSRLDLVTIGYANTNKPIKEYAPTKLGLAVVQEGLIEHVWSAVGRRAGEARRISALRRKPLSRTGAA